MRVAFPTNNQKTIASHIGLAKGFLIIDTNTGEKFYIENPVLKKIHEENINLKDLPEGQRGLGTGRVIPPLLAEAGVNVLIARDFGEGMLRNLAYESIEAIETDEKEIDTVLNQLNENINLKRAAINEDEFYGYGRRMGFGYGRGFGRGLGRGRSFGFGRRMGYGRGFGRRWFD
jgi:predicted Fe-Mo cluster-binding NifX family protein